MADWSQLPPEILTLIAQRLQTRFDVLRFRSVCSSWRSSFKPKAYTLPKNLPSITHKSTEYSLGNITIDTFYLVRLPGANTTAVGSDCGCWVVNVREYTDPVEIELLDPLSDERFLKVDFQKVFDLTSFQVIELDHQFNVGFERFHHPSHHRDIDKVVFLWSSINDGNDFVMLTLFHREVLYVVSCRSGQIQSTLLKVANHMPIDDIISFNGKFYVIEDKGRTIVVDQSLNISYLQQINVGSLDSRNFLVQSGNNLLAVEMLVDPTVNAKDYNNDVVGFRIFRLDEKEQKWDEMESLGDQILFLGGCHAFSASASEFPWGKRNLVFYNSAFSDHRRYYKHLSCSSDTEDIYVFDLDSGTNSCLDYCSNYSDLFWPTPAYRIRT